MKKFLHTYQLDFIFTSLITLTYFVTRLINLTIIPIFTDEAIYLRWSQIGSYDAAWRFIPLTDGKPPLFHWFVMLTVRLFSDPLIAGRIVSVAAGFFSLIGIGLAAYVLTRHKSIAYLSTLLYLASPFMVVYDRLAIVDCLLTTISIYSFILAVLLIQTKRLDVALLLGGTIGAGMLTKASGLIFLLLTPFTAIITPLTKVAKRLLPWIGLLIISAVIAESAYSILRLSQFFYRIGQKNYEFIIPLSKFLQEPFSFTIGNAKSMFKWQFGYLTCPVCLSILAAFLNKKLIRQNLLLLLYYFIPFLMIASFNKIIFPRFLLFSTPFLLILAATGIHNITSYLKSVPQRSLFVLLVLFPSLVISSNLLFSPLKANIPQSDRDQYLDSWPAGWGINETVAYLQDQAAKGPIFVGTQGTFGLMPYAIEIYLWRNPNVEIDSFWPVNKVPDKILAKAQEKTTFFIYNELEDIPAQDNLQLILEFTKRRGDEVRHMRLFKVSPLTQSQ